MAREIPFTARTLANLKPTGERYEVREVGRTGLRARVGATGRVTFRWVCNKRKTVYTLGRFGDGAGGTITLADARAKLDTFKAKHEAGVDPTGPDLGERPKTVKDLCDLWYTQSIILRRRRPEIVKDVIDREIIPTIGSLPLIAVDTARVSTVVVRTVKRGARVHAGRVLQIVKQLFAFAARGYMPIDVAAPLRADDLGVLTVPPAGRHLSAPEIPPVLAAIDSTGMDPVVRLALRFVFFTGLRTHEALTLEWRDIDDADATATVRIENRKLSIKQAASAEPLVQPLSPPALAAVKALRELAPERTPWVFYSAFSKSERLNDKSMEHALRRVRLRDLPKMAPFSPHDFRDTLATAISETLRDRKGLRFPPHVGQMCLGHSLNRILGSSVAAKYDHARRLEERREALHAYAAWVKRLCSGKAAKVIGIGGER
jgi:integrase